MTFCKLCFFGSRKRWRLQICTWGWGENNNSERCFPSLLMISISCAGTDRPSANQFFLSFFILGLVLVDVSIVIYDTDVLMLITCSMPVGYGTKLRCICTEFDGFPPVHIPIWSSVTWHNGHRRLFILDQSLFFQPRPAFLEKYDEQKGICEVEIEGASTGRLIALLSTEIEYVNCLKRLYCKKERYLKTVNVRNKVVSSFKRKRNFAIFLLPRNVLAEHFVVCLCVRPEFCAFFKLRYFYFPWWLGIVKCASDVENIFFLRSHFRSLYRLIWFLNFFTYTYPFVVFYAWFFSYLTRMNFITIFLMGTKHYIMWMLYKLLLKIMLLNLSGVKLLSSDNSHSVSL